MQKRYWLRGVTIGGIVWLVMAVLVVPGSLINSQFSFLPRDVLEVVGTISGISFASAAGMLFGTGGLLAGLLVGCIGYILIGGILAWLYGKFKNPAHKS